MNGFSAVLPRSSRWTTCLALLATSLLIQTGCDEYRISMRIRGGSIERTFSLWDGDEPQVFEEELAARLAREYGKSVGVGENSVTGSFSEAMPQDVGGAGSYTSIATPLGSAGRYSERFRGTDDLVAQLEDVNEGIDRLTDLIAGWLASELGDDPDALVLARFVRERVRPDLKNLYLYVHMSSMLGDAETAYARAIQYLEEREYFRPAELPRITRSFQDESGGLGGGLARLLATKLGVASDQPVPAKLGFLLDSERAETSFEAYVRSTPAFLAWLETHREVEADKQAEKWFDSEFEPVILGFLRLSFDGADLRVALELPEAPFATNGVWDPGTKQVEWLAKLPRETQPSAFAYALWSEPSEAFQKAHFGGVALRGEELFDYAFVYAALTTDETSEWDAFVVALEPGQPLVASLRGFRFSDEPRDPEAEAKGELSTRAKGLIEPLSEAIEAKAW